MKSIRWFAVLSVFVAGFAFSGCKTQVPYQVSVGGPLIQNAKVIGRVEGVGKAKYFLNGWVGPIGDDSLKAAFADALSKKGGDTLINVTVDREVYNFLGLMTEIRTRVTGLAVKYG